MKALAIEVNGLKRSLGGFVLDIPQLNLEPGYVLGLLGRNGAGKSTLIGCLMGLVRPDEGEIRILGRPVPEALVDIRRRTGYVQEQPSFYRDLTVRQMVRLIRPFYPGWDTAAYERYARELEIDDNKPISSLSRGMRVRLALVLALAHRPDLLLLDEPTAGLDPVARQEVLRSITALAEDKELSVLISSHITGDLEQIADFIAIIEDGRLTVHEDRETLGDRWRKVSGRLPDGTPQLDHLFVSWHQADGSYVGVTDSFSETLLHKLASAGVTVAVQARLTLDEILTFATGRGKLGGGQGGE